MSSSSRHPHTPSLARLVAATAWVGLGFAARADTVTLRERVRPTGERVTLGQIAELEGDAASSLAELVVWTASPGSAQAAVTQADLRQALEKSGKPWWRLRLRGFDRCEIEPAGAPIAQLEPPVTPSRPAEAPDATASMAPALPPQTVEPNSTRERSVIADNSVRAIVMEELVRRSGSPAEDLRVSFAPGAEPLLAQAVGEDRIAVELGSRVALGRVPFTVRRLRFGRVMETHRAQADVARRVQAAVLTRTLPKGAVVTPSDVELKELFLLEASSKPIGVLNTVIGQTTARALAAGVMVEESMLAPAVWVRRGQMVDVDCRVGAVLVRSVARAEADGSPGDLIPLRSERTREPIFGRVVDRQRVEISEAPAPASVPATGSDEPPHPEPTPEQPRRAGVNAPAKTRSISSPGVAQR
jgi:flagella basal body P-ring formation protein FlgA